MDKLGLFNIVLANVRANPVSTVNDTTVHAAYCRTFFDLSKQEVLLTHPWSFATFREALTTSGSTDPVWAFEANTPTGNLRVWEIISGDKFAITVDTGVEKILCNVEDPTILYTKDVDVDDMAPAVASALVHLLTSKVAIPIMGHQAGSAVQAREFALYRDELRTAAVMDQGIHRFQFGQSPQNPYFVARGATHGRHFTE